MTRPHHRFHGPEYEPTHSEIMEILEDILVEIRDLKKG